ncbi:MAG: hypothetical protein AB2L14_32485 [Candidatus Xenobiia bacterium LiM19]
MGTVLMAMTLASILAFTLAATGLFHLNVCSRADNALQARNYAESGISRCLEKVIADVYFGEARNETIEINENETIVGQLSFDPAQAKKRDIPFSTNNIMNSASINGCGNRLVPANSIRIVSKGSCNGVTRKIEAIVHIPPFPYCIATSGKFSSEGSIMVGSVMNPDDIKPRIDYGKLFPGNIVSNSRANDAVFLNGRGIITGDLRTSGNVKIEPGSSINVKGELRSHAEPVGIIPINIQSYDPIGKAGVQHLRNFLNNPKVEGYCRVTNNLNVTGDIQLNGSLLYVEGDLNVTGGVKGSGAVVVTGKTRINKGADISSDNLVALLSKGDIRLGGLGRAEFSSFQGIVYTEGNFDARNISVCGAFVNNGTESSTVTLSDARMIKVSSYSQVDVEGPISDSVTFHYANKNSLPLFRLTVAKGKSGSIYTLVDKTSNSRDRFKDRPMVFDTKWKLRNFLINWWIYCEKEGLYGASSAMDNEWDYDQAPSTDWDDPTNDIDRYLNSLVGGMKLDGEHGGNSPEMLFSLNLKEFLGIKDRMRVVFWREI